MSDIKLIKPKFRKSPREKRKEKQDKIGAGIIGGSILGGAAALYKTAKDKIEKAYGKSDKKKGGGMIKAKSGKLADAMKKLRDKAYEKSGKKYKGVGKFGKDEYLIQKPLPGIKKGKMIKLRGGGAAIKGTNFKGVF